MRIYNLKHRVDRMPEFLAGRLNWLTHLNNRKQVNPPQDLRGGGGTHTRFSFFVQDEKFQNSNLKSLKGFNCKNYHLGLYFPFKRCAVFDTGRKERAHVSQ
jgi:hypothetical protein